MPRVPSAHAISVAVLTGAAALAGAGAITIVAATRPERAPVGPVARPVAVMQTDPVPHGGDAADDPAIWVHPVDPDKSLLLGTDKAGGLIVYDMAGRQMQVVSPTCRPDNVDVVYGFKGPDGRPMDLAVASTRGPGEEGAKVWAVDPDTGRLSDVTAGDAARPGGRPRPDGGQVIRVFDRGVPYGVCTYRSRKTGTCYFFVVHKDGRVEQWELVPRGDRVGAARVRRLKLSSTLEGAVADDELGLVYFAEEARGIWRVGAEPDADDKPVLVARVGENGLAADVEGLAIYTASGGKGYLIASSQGNSQFKVYTREGANAFVCTILPRAGAIDGVNDTDGIAVTNRPVGKFDKGLLVVQDGHNSGGKTQNFKAYRWDDIAREVNLLVDPAPDPRK